MQAKKKQGGRVTPPEKSHIQLEETSRIGLDMIKHADSRLGESACGYKLDTTP